MMNKSQILKKIGNIIEELSEQQQYLASTDKINLLELELFTANADFLIDHIEFLKKLNDQRYEGREESTPILNQNVKVHQVAESKIQKPSVEPVEEKQEKKFSFSFDEEPTEMVFDFEKKIAVEEVFDRPLNDDERRLLEEKSSAPKEKPGEFIVLDQTPEQEENTAQAEEEEIEPFLMVKAEEVENNPSPRNIVLTQVEQIQPDVVTPVPVIPTDNSTSEPEPQTIQSVPVQPEEKEPTTNQQFETAKVASEVSLDKKEDRPLTLNEMLSAKLSQTGGQNYQRQAKKLEDLKAAISINDKMVFIKELFNGYNLAYSEAIEIVNRFESFEAADNFLQKNYSVKNDWENKQITVARFYEYLHKKFVM